MKITGTYRLLLVGAIVAVCYFLMRPYLFFIGDQGVILAFPAEPEKEFTIKFIHSVQKTPVEENLRIDDELQGFILVSTKYQSFGVGLPFLKEEGEFRKEGGYFIFSQMNRRFQALALRSGVGNELTILYEGKEYPIYRMVDVGSKIELSIEPYYKRFLY